MKKLKSKQLYLAGLLRLLFLFLLLVSGDVGFYLVIGEKAIGENPNAVIALEATGSLGVKDFW
jgi:hypothetical protein